jgi:hypothetical protein
MVGVEAATIGSKAGEGGPEALVFAQDGEPRPDWNASVSCSNNSRSP